MKRCFVSNRKFGFGDLPVPMVIIAPEGKIITTRSSLPPHEANQAALPEQLKKEVLAALGSRG